MVGRFHGARAFQTPWFHIHEPVTLLTSRQLFLKLHSTSPNGQGTDDLYTAYNTLLTAVLSIWSNHNHFTPATFVTFVQSVLSGLPSTSSSPPEPSSLAWLRGSLVDMLWSIDMELDELVAESKSCEAISENGHKKDGEKDKLAVADLVRKLLVRGVLEYFVGYVNQFSRRPPGSCNQVHAENGSIVALFTLPVLVLISRIGTSAKFARGRVFCLCNPPSVSPITLTNPSQLQTK